MLAWLLVRERLLQIATSAQTPVLSAAERL